MASPNRLSTTPPEGSQHRSLYERAYRKSNHLLCASTSIDHRIDMLQQAITRGTTVDTHTEIAHMEYTALEALSLSDQEGSGSWIDYFRLMSQYRFLEQRIAVPLVFSGGNEKYTAMRHFVDGTYGISVDILLQAMQEYYRSDTSAKRYELTGVISEQTTLVLLNRSENLRHFALPASTKDDLHRRTDIDYWRLTDKKHSTDGEEYTQLIPVQVKTRPPRTPIGATTPKKPHGITVDAYDTGNSDNFRTAHLLIRELGYTLNDATPSGLIVDQRQGIDEQAELNAIHAAFMNTVEEKYLATQLRTQPDVDHEHHRRATNPFIDILPLIQRTQ